MKVTRLVNMNLPYDLIAKIDAVAHTKPEIGNRTRFFIIAAQKLLNSLKK